MGVPKSDKSSGHPIADTNDVCAGGLPQGKLILHRQVEADIVFYDRLVFDADTSFALESFEGSGVSAEILIDV